MMHAWDNDHMDNLATKETVPSPDSYSNPSLSSGIIESKSNIEKKIGDFSLIVEW